MESIGDIATVTVHIKKIKREKVSRHITQYIETIWRGILDLKYKN